MPGLHKKPSQRFPSHRRRSGPLISRPFSFAKNHRNNSHSTTSPVQTHRKRQSRAAGGSSPCERKHLQWREFFPERVRSRTTGGLRPPALGGSAVRTFADKTATCAIHDRPFTRAAGVSPPWERNASATARVFPGASTFAHHGGLRPPLLAACADVIADIRFAPTSTHLFPRGAYAPRSWRFCGAEICWRNCDFSGAQTHVSKSDGCQPAVGTKRICNGAGFSRSEYVRAPRGAYAPRSWLHVRMSLQIYASHQRVRCFSHGGLTPPALGCMCGCHCRYTLRTNEYAAFPTAGLRQPLLVDGDAMIRKIAVCNGQCMCTRVAMERSELADIRLLFARMHVHKSGDGVVVVPVSLALRLANFKRTCTRVRQLHCNYRQKQGRGLRISNARAQDWRGSGCRSRGTKNVICLVKPATAWRVSAALLPLASGA
jgi:hypothetical protein